jgi:hypothetical protein
MTDKLEVGQLRIWRDWAHMDSVFKVLRVLGNTAYYKYIDETEKDADWVAQVESLIKNTIPCTKLHKLLMGMTD